MYADYAERAYFTTDACHHCATRDEHKRLQRKRDAMRRAIRERRRAR